MSRAPKRCECGGTLKILPKPGRRNNIRRLARHRRVPGHDLCARCWRTFMDRTNSEGRG